ncbi:putative bifunctional diguanylate cyclase/phosphodiesterase [Litchfieldella xinjiangensis]|uniref:putative bifunctional diguanylate cyclase/phosphodiesterase n=1 Tax=Litchfieldella xinjiangensis TaxID=1166948 RepID=UPI001E3A7885|nr:GGDEF domain-containing phosphodiesterase [Halomonas xinjiangensis]
MIANKPGLMKKKPTVGETQESAWAWLKRERHALKGAAVAAGIMALLVVWFLLSVPSLLAVAPAVGMLASAFLVWQQWQSQTGRASPASGELQVAQRRLSDSEQRFRALLESLPKVAVQGYDRHRRVIYWNEASTQLYGYTPCEAQGRALEDLIIPEPMREEVIAAHRLWMTHGTEIPAAELELRHKSGAPVAVFSHHVMLGEQTQDPLMFCVDVDLSVQKQARRDLEFLTRFDSLTHLPNRQTFESELNAFTERCHAMGDYVAVFVIDLDRFAEINDAQGYEHGDALLFQVAKRLRRCQRSSDLLSRFGSDEFAMAFPHLKHSGDALRLVEKVLDVFSEPFILTNREIHVSASIGISLFPDNGTTARELIHNADVAKNRAKLSGSNRYGFFQKEVHDELVRQHHMVERLRHALRRGELALHYQPQVAARSGRIENLEALLRWFPQEGGTVSPAEFIPVAERSSLIHRIGEWVIREACRQQAEWKRVGLGDHRIDINLSGKQVSQLDVFDHLEACMQEFGLSPRDIGIELTENVLIQSDDRVLDVLRRLHHRGMKIAIDDFGTGYSSLSYLKLFPVTALKIDRSFVRDAPSDLSDRAIMAATVFIGHRLGLEVVAEGVENEEQLELVQELGCDLVQGFYHYKPMSAADIQRMLAVRLLVVPRIIRD